MCSSDLVLDNGMAVEDWTLWEQAARLEQESQWQDFRFDDSTRWYLQEHLTRGGEELEGEKPRFQSERVRDRKSVV